MERNAVGGRIAVAAAEPDALLNQILFRTRRDAPAAANNSWLASLAKRCRGSRRDQPEGGG